MVIGIVVVLSKATYVANERLIYFSFKSCSWLLQNEIVLYQLSTNLDIRPEYQHIKHKDLIREVVKTHGLVLGALARQSLHDKLIYQVLISLGLCFGMLCELVKEIGWNRVVIPKLFVFEHAEIGTYSELLEEDGSVDLTLAFFNADKLRTSLYVRALFLNHLLPCLFYDLAD